MPLGCGENGKMEEQILDRLCAALGKARSNLEASTYTDPSQMVVFASNRIKYHEVPDACS